MGGTYDLNSIVTPDRMLGRWDVVCKQQGYLDEGGRRGISVRILTFVPNFEQRYQT